MSLTKATYSLINGAPVNVLDFGAKNDGTVASNAAAFTAAANAATASGTKFGKVYVPSGDYLMDADITTPLYVNWIADGATLKASANSRIFFKSTVSAYFTRFSGFRFIGNGKTGVVGFSMTNWRLSASIDDCTFEDMTRGLDCVVGCFGAVMSNCNMTRVINPVRFQSDASGFHIISPQFDNGPTVAGDNTGIGIEIATGSPANFGVRVTSGYVQGFATGVNDGGIGTSLNAVYFETNTVADVNASGARQSSYHDISLPSTSAGVGFKLRNCDAITIMNPVMTSGGRTALYDVDATNTNCQEYRTLSNASYNSPTGTLTYLGRLTIETIGTFTPVLVGSTTAGVGTYTTQAGRWRKSGNRVSVSLEIAWSAHTGTGNMTLTGIPGALTPTSFASPGRFGNFVAVGFAVAGPILTAQLNGTGTNMTLIQTSAAGAQTLVPMTGAGTLLVNIEYDL
jgi:hypothetical protein